MNHIYFARFNSKIGLLKIATSQKGVCKIALPNEEENLCMQWLEKRFPQYSIIENPDKNLYVIQQLKEYFDGKRKKFDVKLHLVGTPFEKRVWKALMEIPYGKTASYAEIALKIGKPTAFRAVGNANGKNPIPIIIPCHRVINSSGELGGYGGGLDLKRRLLELEANHANYF